MDVDEFNNYMSPLLSKITKEKKTLLLLGDFNINLLKCNSENSHSDFLDLLGSFQILPYITLPTRITNISSTLIDNIFVSSTPYTMTSGNLTVNLSDHLPQFLFLSMSTESKKLPKLGFYRKWANFDSNKFSDEFSNIDWNEVLAIDKGNVNHSFDSFLQTFSIILDNHVPLSQQTRKQEQLKNKPWIPKGILTSIKIRDNLFKDFLETSSPELKLFLQSRYKQYRNRIVSLLSLFLY